MKEWERVSEEGFSLDKMQKMMEELRKPQPLQPTFLGVITYEEWKRLVQKGMIGNE